MRRMLAGMIGIILGVSLLVFNVDVALVNAMSNTQENIGVDLGLVGYEISNEKIVPGSDFTLTLHFINHGNRRLRGIVVEVYNPNGVAPVYGTVSQKYIEEVEGKGTFDVSFDYNSYASIYTSTLDFMVTVKNAMGRNEIPLRVPVGMENPFVINNIGIPAQSYKGEKVTCAMTFKLLGNTDIHNVTTKLLVDKMLKETASIGTVVHDTTKTQGLILEFEEPGEHLVEMFLEYDGDDGKRKTVLVSSKTVTVVEQDVVSPDDASNIQIEKEQVEEKDISFILIGSGLMILILFLIMAAVVKKIR